MSNNHQDTNYKELVNPTFTTGQATLEMLAASGNPDAITYKQLLSVDGVTEKVGGNANEGNKFFSPEEAKALMMGITLSVEARYAAVSRLLKDSGCKSMLDIASGYTPRALMCQKEGIDYVGMDLPAVVDKMQPLAQKVLTAGSHPTYVTGDVTNATSLMQAAELLQGELFISCEGLLTYLNTSELEQAINRNAQQDHIQAANLPPGKLYLPASCPFGFHNTHVGITEHRQDHGTNGKQCRDSYNQQNPGIHMNRQCSSLDELQECIGCTNDPADQPSQGKSQDCRPYNHHNALQKINLNNLYF